MRPFPLTVVRPTDSDAKKIQWCIDAIQAALTPEEWRGYLKGSVMKYVWRADEKGQAIEDLRKAAWYVAREIERREKQAATPHHPA